MPETGSNVMKWNKAEILGGPGRLVINDDISLRPTKISDVMDLTAPFALKEGWRDLGATQEGINISRGFDTEDFEIDQSVQPIDRTISSFTTSLSTTLAQDSINNRQLAMIGGTIKENAATLGEPVTLTAPTLIGAKVIKVGAVTGIQKDGFVIVGDETRQVANVDAGTKTVTLKKSLEKAHEADTLEQKSVTPVTELGTKEIGYGAPSEIDHFQTAIISKMDDGTLRLTVFYDTTLSGDEVETTYGKDKKVLPIGLTAFPVDDLPEDENVFKEFQQTV